MSTAVDLRALDASDDESIGPVVEERRHNQAEGHDPRPATNGRRASPRRRVLLGALIVEPEGDGFCKCRLENLSDGGARIRLFTPRFLPPSFWLIATTSGFAYRARLVWRKDDQIGVQFGDPTDLRDPVTFAERRLQKMWRRSC